MVQVVVSANWSSAPNDPLTWYWHIHVSTASSAIARSRDTSTVFDSAEEAMREALEFAKKNLKYSTASWATESMSKPDPTINAKDLLAMVVARVCDEINIDRKHFCTLVLEEPTKNQPTRK